MFPLYDRMNNEIVIVIKSLVFKFLIRSFLFLQDLTVTDDTVLEEHNEDPSLVQMRLIGDGGKCMINLIQYFKINFTAFIFFSPSIFTRLSFLYLITIFHW